MSKFDQSVLEPSSRTEQQGKNETVKPLQAATTLIFTNGVEMLATSKLTIYCSNTNPKPTFGDYQPPAFGYEVTFDLVGNASTLTARKLAKELAKGNINDIYGLDAIPVFVNVGPPRWRECFVMHPPKLDTKGLGFC